ncbi:MULTISPECIES: hypothetical protein [unclassified Pseudomonas]|uniref:hypothetical protein n=1 Tax=unclassified Pseudomonas TaxID=196821 RepID=UPI0035BFD601
MKSLTLLLAASVLSLSTHVLADPATNCDAKIKELEGFIKADGPGMAGGMVEDFKNLLAQAKEAQAAGDMTKCQASADRAKTIYNKARSH